MNDKISIIVADAQNLSRIGLSQILSQHYYVNEACNGATALQMTEELKPRLVIIDYSISSSFSIEHIATLKSLYSELKILVISADENEKRVLQVSELGIQGFITKDCDAEEVLNAVASVLKGEKFFCNKILNIIINQINQKSASNNCESTSLSKREVEIVQLITNGFTNTKIAEKLGLSRHTVHTHRKNIMKKIQGKSTSDVVLYAIKTGMTQPSN